MVKVFDKPQIFEEQTIIEFDLDESKPNISTKYFYNGIEVNYAKYYLLHLQIREVVFKKFLELKTKESGNNYGVIFTGLHIFRTKIERNLHLLAQADIVKFEKTTEIQKEGNKIRIILNMREVYPNVWEFKPKDIDKELEKGLIDYITNR
ncbi:MAG: hypothetical protein ACO2ON_01665 [Candidatus Nanopusillus sp.]